MISATIAYVIIVAGCLGIIAWAVRDAFRLIREIRRAERANRQRKEMFNQGRR